MTRRRLVAIALLPALAAAAYATREWVHPWWMKKRTHAALEQAASNLCACMLGKHGDRSLQRRFQAGAFVEGGTDERGWPDRCEPWGTACKAAYDEAWKWDDLLDDPKTRSWRDIVEPMEAYWARDPDPRVPIPSLGSFALDTVERVPFVRGKELFPNDAAGVELRITGDRLTVRGDGFFTIHPDDHVEKLAEPPPPKQHPKHPDWRAIDGDPGARSCWFDGNNLVDDSGRPLTSQWFLYLEWAHAYADGRIVAIAIEGTLENASMLYEIGQGGSVKKVPFSFGSSLFHRSMVELDGSIVWKRLPAQGGPATVEVIDMSLGAAAKPLVLGPIERPMRGVEHTYGPCHAKTTFIDMDPSVVAHTIAGEWKYLSMEPPANRVMSCEGDVAVVTEWPPLEIRRCTKDGCAKLPFPGMSINGLDRFGADEHHLFRLFVRGGIFGMDVFTLDPPLLVRRIALDDKVTRRIPTLRVVAGRAIVLFDTDGDWSAISVRPDGSVRAVR